MKDPPMADTGVFLKHLADQLDGFSIDGANYPIDGQNQEWMRSVARAGIAKPSRLFIMSPWLQTACFRGDRLGASRIGGTV